MELKKLNIQYLDKNEEGDDVHEYRNKEGKLLAGVSTVSELLPKPWLAAWAANEMEIGLLPRLEEVKKMTQGEWEVALKEAKKAHKVKSEDAKEIGTKVHEYLERYVNFWISGGAESLTTDLEKEEPSIIRPVKEFLKWVEENKVKWLYSELLVGSEKYDVAGRLDAVAEVNGKLSLIDFKTSNNIYESYYLQPAGYYLCLEEMGLKCEQRIIIRVPKTETKKEYDATQRKKVDVPNNLEVMIVGTPLEFDTETFLHLRTVYKWLNMPKVG
jgi:hypothetical protein